MYHDSALIKGQRKHFRVFTFKPPGLPICDQGGDCDLINHYFFDLQKDFTNLKEL
jgi:hypothetical protein